MTYNINEFLKLAEKSILNEDFSSARSYYEKILSIQPNHQSTINNLSLLYMKNNEIEKAKSLLIDILKIEKNNSLFHNSLGLIYYKQRNFFEAEKCFTTTLLLQKDHLPAMYNLALSLYAQNKKSDAIAALLAIISADEKFFQAYFLIGKISLEEKKFEQAKIYFSKIAEQSHDNTDMLKNILAILLEYDQYKLAKPYCYKLLSVDPENISLLYNAGVIAEKENDLLIALELYEKILLICPDHFAALNNAAVLYLKNQEPKKAELYFEKALLLQPENESIRYTLGALRGEQSNTIAPKNYIAQLFDAYAEHFDQHLTEGLDYRVPSLLYNACQPYFPSNSLNILDLGCGTGLTAQEFLKVQKKMVGVDLSKKMLEMAMNKKIYSELYCEEISAFLSRNKERFDCILAGDVLVYTGNLIDLFFHTSHTLNELGLFAFSIELSQKENFLLRPSGRFAHSKNYIRDLAQEYQFEILIEQETATRSQFNQPVLGILYVLRKLKT